VCGAPHVFVLGKGQAGDGWHVGNGQHDGRRHENHGKGQQAGGTTTARAAALVRRVLLQRRASLEDKGRGVPVPEEGESVWERIAVRRTS
jgi:hypothetical protein